MIKYKRYGLALNPDEDLKFNKVKNHYDKGVKKIFMSMVNAMYNKIPIQSVPVEVVTPTETNEEKE